MSSALDVVDTDIVTGRRTKLAATARLALRALDRAGIPFAVVGAAALAARGLPRMTRDLDIVVLFEDAFAALDALAAEGFRSVAPIDHAADPEAMYVLVGPSGVEVDVLVANAEPESTIVAEAPRANVFGVEVPLASLEHLILMYLYSNQPRHLGDFARIVTETAVDLSGVERYLADVHPEMLPTLRERVRLAKSPPPAPPRPPRRKRSGR
jgi:hypothetical protein